MISLEELLGRVPINSITIWRKMRDGTFPHARQVGEKRIGWIESEIDEWLLSRPNTVLKGDVVAPAAANADQS
jgi:prophage regulatory protein